jgi:hypothetical protein
LFLYRERWKVIRKNLKEHTCFKRLNNGFTLDAGVIYFCAAPYKKYAFSHAEKKMATTAENLTDGFKNSVFFR